jgi:hypothetical protein
LDVHKIDEAGEVKGNFPCFQSSLGFWREVVS